MLPLNFQVGTMGGFPLALVALYGLFWMLILGLALTRGDLDPVTRLTWIVVIVFVPLVGALFYLILAPPRLPERRIDPSKTLSGTPWENDPGHTRER